MTFARFIILLVFLLLSKWGFADQYPKNLGVDILDYTFQFTLSDETDEISCRTIIVLSVKKESQQQLRLDFVKRSDELDGKGMLVDKLEVDGQAATFTHEGEELFIKYPAGPQIGDLIKIVIDYHGIPADGLRIGKNKYGDRGFFSENWPVRARHWLPVIDHPYEKASCSFIVTAPAQYSVISNGLKQEESIVDPGLKLTHWKQSVPISSWLYVLGVSEFAIQYLDNYNGISIESWVYKQDRDVGFEKFATPTKKCLAFFSDYIGPYGYEKLVNIQSPSVGGAMETASAIFYDENSFDDKRSDWLKHTIVHEVAHHWFGNSVTEYNWDDAWLSEGFATFFTLLFREHAYGYDDYLAGLRQARERMITFYERQPDYQIIADNIGMRGSPTSGATYQKGAWVLHMLRRKVGDAHFKTAIQSYYRRFRDATAVTKDLIHEMEWASGMELDSFFQQWLYQGGIPKLACEWTYLEDAKELEIHLQQLQDEAYSFKLEVPLGVYTKDQDSPEVLIFSLDSREKTFRIPLPEKPARLSFDPEVNLLATCEMVEQN